MAPRARFPFAHGDPELSSHDPAGAQPRWHSSPAGGFAPSLGWTPRLEAAFAALGRPELIAARVAAVHRGRLELLSAAGALAGAASGRMAHAAVSAADLPAVGDWVAADPDSGLVHALLPRRGGIARAADEGRSEPQVLAANVDLALVVGCSTAS
jgi:ribosome biogenesis GTPase